MKPKVYGNSERCDVCKAWTKYNNVCAVHQMQSHEDNLRYRGMFEVIDAFLPGNGHLCPYDVVENLK